jgi:hypothetical protein
VRCFLIIFFFDSGTQEQPAKDSARRAVGTSDVVLRAGCGRPAGNVMRVALQRQCCIILETNRPRLDLLFFARAQSSCCLHKTSDPFCAFTTATVPRSKRVALYSGVQGALLLDLLCCDSEATEQPAQSTACATGRTGAVLLRG